MPEYIIKEKNSKYYLQDRETEDFLVELSRRTDTWSDIEKCGEYFIEADKWVVVNDRKIGALLKKKKEINKPAKPTQTKILQKTQEKGKKTNILQKLSGSDFLNPYNFVQINAPTPMYAIKSPDYIQGNSGYIDIELENITPLFIGGVKSEKDHDEHVSIDFFKDKDALPTVPGSSIKGMIRNRMEILSNSCLNHDYAKDDLLNYMSKRLNLEKDSDRDVIQKLNKGVITRRNQKWVFIQLESAKVLTMIENRVEDGSLYLACSDKPEKLSIKSSNKNASGIDRYCDEKERYRRLTQEKVREIDYDSTGNHIAGINNHLINHRVASNKTFPFLDLKNFDHDKRYYGVIRELNKGHFCIYKLKALSDTRESLRDILHSYTEAQHQENYRGNGVQYRICELIIKTSCDIDTKTQDQVFFHFGEDNIGRYLSEAPGTEIDVPTLIKFRNEIKKRYRELRDHSDQKGYIKKIQPAELYEGMPVFAHIRSNKVEYLAYSQVARKPYKTGIDDIVKEMKKSQCEGSGEVCPACNIFGYAEGSNSLAGRISVSSGRITNTGVLRSVTLKILNSPKPSYYPFYLLNNRKGAADDKRRIATYDNDKRTLEIGRKQYINHAHNKLDYQSDEKTKMNVTVNTLSPGAVINFKIRFKNLNDYELGLLLYAIRTEYKDEALLLQLGMGKPLGLGRLKNISEKVIITDRKKRYSSLLETGETVLADNEIKEKMDIYKNIQSLNDTSEYSAVLKSTDTIASYANNENAGRFYELPYIKDFISLNRINHKEFEAEVKYPAKKRNNELVGFEWFMNERNQSLFEPEYELSIPESVLKNYG